MIKIGIEGGGSAEAGELIRLLINHPDVELVQVCQPEYAGRDISDIHHGLVGEKKLPFSKKPDYDSVDIMFYTSEAGERTLTNSDEFIGSKSEPDSGFAIYVSPTDELLEESAPYYLKCHDEDEGVEAAEADDWSRTVVYGVPELNRKPLVRGARKVVIPTAVESVAAVALSPFRERGIFPDSIELRVEGASELMESYSASKDAIEHRLGGALSALFEKPVKVAIELAGDSTTKRCISVSAEVAMNVTIDEVRSIVADAYADHNLAHLSGKALSYNEVEGTDNCLIEVSRAASGLYRIHSVADARLRGGAGEAVHIMNLFAGLFEKTGLHLKASNF